MGSEADQALLQPQEEEVSEFGQSILNLNQLKSFEILKSAMENFRSNTKFMALMVLSSFPFFAFMIIYEIEIHKVIDALSKLLVRTSPIYTVSSDFGGVTFYDENDEDRKIFHNLLQLFPFYLVLCPLLELLSLTIIINIAAKIYAGEKESTSMKGTIVEVFYQRNNFKGALITCFWVQLQSICTLLGLFWTVANHRIITNGFYDYSFIFEGDYYVNILSIGFHSIIFMAVLYKYLDWSALWNMGMVVSVLAGETGFDALEVAAYYGKHARRTGFQLMLVFFVYGVVLRLPFLVAGFCDVGSVGITVTGIVVGLVCLGNLVKWVALVLYFYDCKAHMMWKKVDEEVGKAVKAGDVC